VGLIASRLKDKYYKPTFVIGINEDRVVGSGRSIAEWNMIAAMQLRPDLFTKFGGHPQACGFSLENPAAIPIFAAAMHELAHTQVEKITELIPTVMIDVRVNLDALDWDLLAQLEKFAPFGVGNPEPQFLAERMHVVDAVHVGETKKHVRLMIKNGTPAVKKMMAFNMGEHLKTFQPGAELNGVLSFSCNEWQGRRELQYKLHDFRMAV
jgi:single-stranded-DNA-specific exonuclease